MRLSLKAGERIFINGAVLKADRRVTLELLNDATFLLEAHVMQLEGATTPLRQLYFIIQSMLISPANQLETRTTVLQLIPQMLESYGEGPVAAGLVDVRALIVEGRVFEALRLVRGLFQWEPPPPRAEAIGDIEAEDNEPVAFGRIARSKVA